MVSKSKVQAEAEINYKVRIREENLKDIQTKNDDLVRAVENQELELELYTSLDDSKFIKPEGEFQFEREIEFGKFMRSAKIKTYSDSIAEGHKRINTNNELINIETISIELIKEGVDIDKLSNEEIKSRG